MQKTAFTLTPTLPRQETFAQPSFPRRRESRRGGSQIGNLRVSTTIRFPQQELRKGLRRRESRRGGGWVPVSTRTTGGGAPIVTQGELRKGLRTRGPISALAREQDRGRSPSRRPSRSGRKSGLMQEECDQECWNPQPEARHLVQGQTLRPSRERLRTSPISSSLTRARPPARHRPECGRLWPAAGPPSWPRDQDRSRCPGRKA